MITKEECTVALENLKNGYRWMLPSGENAFDKSVSILKELINAHFELIEKATPKKTIWNKSGGFYECPNCTLSLEYVYDLHKRIDSEFECCPYCGQALDWSEEE